MTIDNPLTAPTDEQKKVHLKFCGMTRAEDYRKATELGADYAGFIFHPKSPRFVTAEKVAAMAAEVPGGIPRVGVFVDQAVDEIKRIADVAGLSVLQLHGGQDAAFAVKLPLPVWKVIRLKEDSDLQVMETFPAKTFLLDAYVKDLPGGTGHSIPGDLLARAIRKARDLGKQVWVAGGISPENIGDFIGFHPFGVDVNSGAESAPGIKDGAKMKRIRERLGR